MELSQTQQSEIIATAHAMADAGRPIALSYFRSTAQDVQNKLTDDFDPVTLADKEIELAFRKVLAEQRPNDGILGEEFPDIDGTSGLTWVLDPIDGTRGFISGTPTWGMLIALYDGHKPVFGMMDQPYTGERFIGGFGRNELLSNFGQRPLQVRKCADLKEAVIFTTFPEVGSASEQAAFQRVSQRCKLTRYGMDCYAYSLLAAGQVDLVIEAGLNAYDIQAPIAIVQAAGGIVTNWQGGPADQGGQAIAASDPRIHEAALKLLNA